MKKLIILTVIIIIGLVCIATFSLLRQTPVDCIMIEQKDYENRIEEEGTIVSSEEITLYSMINEKVSKINVTEGQSVNKGDVLLTIDDTLLKYQLAILNGQKDSLLGKKLSEGEKVSEYEINAQKTSIDLAESDLSDAVKHYEKCRILFSEGAISKDEFEIAEKIKNTAEKNYLIQKATLGSLEFSNTITLGLEKQYMGSLEQIEAQIDLLKYQIDQCIIRAPIDGVVCELNYKETETVSPETPLVTIFKPLEYEAEIYVLSEDVVSLNEEMKVEIIRKQNSKEEIFEGKIQSISPIATKHFSTLGIEEQRVKISVRIDNENNSILRPGEKIEATFISAANKDSIIIPKEAIFPHDLGYGVWLIKNGKVVIQPIEEGVEIGSNIMIKNGIQAGDYIVYPLKDLILREGMRVKMKK